MVSNFRFAGRLKSSLKTRILLKVVENSLKFCSDGIERITVIERFSAD